jgi:protein TonB
LAADLSIASQDRLCAWAAALGAAAVAVCVLGELAGPVRAPADDHHDHGPGAPVQYFTPPAQPASQPSAKSDAPSSAPAPAPEVVAPIEPLSAVPVTAMASLLPIAAVRPVATVSRPVAAAALSAERFVPDMPGDFPDPPYPRWARQQGVQGRLLVLVDVAASGAPSSVAVRESSGHLPLDQHAVDWLRQRWTWAPGAPRRFLVPLVFELQ